MRLRRLLLWLAIPAVVTAAPGLDFTMARNDIARSGYTAEKLSPPLALQWKFATGEDKNFSAQPLVVGNRIFFCSLGSVYSLDAETGAMLWQYDTRFAIRATPVVVGGSLFVFNLKGEVHVLSLADVTGERLQRKLVIPGGVSCNPVLQGSTMYVVADNGRLYSFDLAAGAEKEIERFDSKPKGSLLYSDEQLFFTGADGLLHCYDLRRKRKLWAQQQGSLVSPPVVVGPDLVVNTRDGTRSVKIRSGQRTWQRAGITAARGTPAYAHDRIYSMALDATLYVLEPKKGEIVGKVALDAVPETGVTIADREIYYGTMSGNVWCRDALTLEPKWYYRCNPIETVGVGAPKYPIAVEPVVANGNVLVVTTQGTLFCLRADALDAGLPRLYLPQLVTTAVDGSLVALPLYDDEWRAAERAAAEALATGGAAPQYSKESEQLALPGKQKAFYFETFVYDEGSGVNIEAIRVLWDGQPYLTELMEMNDSTYRLQVKLISDKPTGGIQRDRLPDGDHTLTLTVPDFKGNQLTRSFTFTIDNSLPPLEPVKKKPTTPGPGGEGAPAVE